MKATLFASVVLLAFGSGVYLGKWTAGLKRPRESAPASYRMETAAALNAADIYYMSANIPGMPNELDLRSNAWRKLAFWNEYAKWTCARDVYSGGSAEGHYYLDLHLPVAIEYYDRREAQILVDHVARMRKHGMTEAQLQLYCGQWALDNALMSNRVDFIRAGLRNQDSGDMIRE